MRAAVLDNCSLQSENYGLWILAPLRALNRDPRQRIAGCSQFAWDSSDLSKSPKLSLATGLWRIQRWYLAGSVHYIEQQLEHHRTRTFQEEYLAFLQKHGAPFDEKYLWD
ncbi:MAG TPA: hypothetical protein VGX93_03775 [Chthoniobacterales bacterium]|jgi:hypothetical protein|nr:hypothetical protein [Chthoniobacterales bacterium]